MSSRGILFRRNTKQNLIESGIRVGETVLATDTLELGTSTSGSELKWYKVSNLEALSNAIENSENGEFLVNNIGLLDSREISEVPNGGYIGQILAKFGDDNGEFNWIDAPSGGGGGDGPTVTIVPTEVNTPGSN